MANATEVRTGGEAALVKPRYEWGEIQAIRTLPSLNDRGRFDIWHSKIIQRREDLLKVLDLGESDTQKMLSNRRRELFCKKLGLEETATTDEIKKRTELYLYVEELTDTYAAAVKKTLGKILERKILPPEYPEFLNDLLSAEKVPDQKELYDKDPATELDATLGSPDFPLMKIMVSEILERMKITHEILEQLIKDIDAKDASKPTGAATILSSRSQRPCNSYQPSYQPSCQP